MITLFLLLSHMALIQSRYAECRKCIHTLVVPKALIPSLPSVIPSEFSLRMFICILIIGFAIQELFRNMIYCFAERISLLGTNLNPTPTSA